MLKIKATSTVSTKGLTTIPKEIRKKLNIKKGDKIYWILTKKKSKGADRNKILKEIVFFHNNLLT